MVKDKVSIHWGMGGVTISVKGASMSLDYTDLIKSFLKVDIKTRQIIGEMLFNFFKKAGKI